MRRRRAEQSGWAKLTTGHGAVDRETGLAGRASSSRPQSAGLRCLIAGFGLANSFIQPAFAGAWVQEQGSAYLRASLALEDHSSFEATRSDVYAEWGVTHNWTVSAKYETVDFKLSNAFDSDGWRVTARRKLWAKRNFTTSAELGALKGAALGGFRGCESLGVEAAAAAGYGSKLLTGDVYAGLTLARREHEDDCYHNRLELVLGYSPDGKWFWTGQIWSERGDTDKSDKVEIMRMRRYKQAELGVGLRREVSGEFDETALVFSLAYRPVFADR